ncbi:MAG: hypothetical protein V3V08_09370 [Nannocystaceae bacterium]
MAPGGRPVWTLRGDAGWGLALTRNVSLSGDHGITIYSAGHTQLRVHAHALGVALRPGAGSLAPAHRDRLSFGVETRTLMVVRVRTSDGWQDFDVGGIRDVTFRLAYGMEHAVGKRWHLGWQLAPGYSRVFLDSQRLLRGALRAALRPVPDHELRGTITAHLVHRDASQFGGNDFRRASAHLQASGAWIWMSRHNVGTIVQGRLLSSFMSGEAPIYEVREETLRTPYAEASVGVLATW